MIDQDRQLALLIARARVGVGVAMLLVPGPLSGIAVGRNTRETRVALRLAGSRDVSLGLGALTSTRERTQDAEWVSMGAFVDGVDAFVLLFTPGLPTRTRMVGVVAAVTAVAGLRASRRLADERITTPPVD